MAISFFTKLIFIGIVSLMGLYQFSPENFDKVVDGAKQGIRGVAEDGFDIIKNKTLDLIENKTEFERIDNITFLNLGMIKQVTEIPCESDGHCNEFISECNNNCLCSSSEECLKAI